MEETGCEIICGAPTTLAVKGEMRERDCWLRLRLRICITGSSPYFLLARRFGGLRMRIAFAFAYYRKEGLQQINEQIFTITYSLTASVVGTPQITASFLQFSLISTAFCDLAYSRPVHSLMLSPNLFICLPCLLPPFTVPCKVVLAGPDERET